MNKYIIFILAFFISCNEQYRPISYLGLESKERNYLRFPANISDNKCFLDEFGIDRIREDIAVMESKWIKKVKVPKAFDQIDLKPAETHYIKRFHKYIFLNEDSSSCSSLSCLLNIAYGNHESEAGDRIYHWYLSMGTGISTLDSIPTYDRTTFKDKTLKDFLFPVKELKLLNITSKILSSKYKNLYISTMHRFPDNTSPGTSVAGMYNGFTGASSKPFREIFLTNQYSNHSNTDEIKGYYFHTLIHELTHALDFSHGDSNKILSYVSTQKNWTDLSWEWGEAKITVEQEIDGIKTKIEKTIMKWLPVEGKTNGFLRAYMKVSPKEDFADAGSYFIISPDTLNSKAKDKYEKFKEEFYFGDSFRDAVEVELIQKELSNYLATNINSIVKNCALDGYESKRSDFSLLLPEISILLDPKTKNCLIDQIETIISEKMLEVKSLRYKSCKVIKGKETEYIQNAVDRNEVFLEESLNQIGEIGQAKESWSKLRTDLKNTCDPTSIYLSTRDELDPSEEYSKIMITCINNVFDEYSNITHLLEVEMEEYLKINKYNKAITETENKFNDITKGLTTFLESSAVIFVESCRNSTSFKYNKYLPVSGGSIFVNNNSLNCINEQINESFDDVLRDFLGEKYNVSKKGLLYISKKNFNHYVTQINNALYNVNVKEEILYKDSIQDIMSTVFNKSINSESLIHNYLNKNSSFKQMFNLSVKNDLKSFWSTKGNPITISLSETISLLRPLILTDFIINANKENLSEITKLKSLNKETSDRLFNKFQNLDVWSFKYSSISNFKDACYKSIHSEVEVFSNNIMEEFKYLSSSALIKKTKIEICERLESILKKELDLSTYHKENLSKEIKKLIYTTTEWRSTIRDEDLKTLCLESIDLNLNETVKSNLKLLNMKVIINNVLIKECQAFISNWIKIDLKSIESYVLCSGECRPQKPSLYADLNQDHWNLYLASSLVLFEKEAESIFDIVTKPRLDECKIKYPQIRYSVMKLKRKKCLLAKLNEKISMDRLDHSIEALNIIQILLDKKTNDLKLNLGTYMK